jgi:iron-sulfur cluster repair protein YtfE (RIC family)
MRPSEVRERVLSDHEELRGRLAELEELARASLERGPGAGVGLRTRAEDLLDHLAIHMSWEDRYLVPVLRAADGWGEARSGRLAREHLEQRELLEYALRQLHDADRPEAVVARNLLDLVALLREDMLEEECAFLDERLLRDDPLVVDVVTG